MREPVTMIGSLSPAASAASAGSGVPACSCAAAGLQKVKSAVLASR
jgi:hypothetical protein